MSTAQAVKIPQPLAGEEIKEGVRKFVLNAGAPEFIASEIRKGLNGTCLLNGCAYSKVKIDWKVVAGEWRVDYELDDFGRIARGMMNGRLPSEFEEIELRGSIEPMPPDRFRRESEQKIPFPTLVNKTHEESNSFSQSRKGRGKVREV